MKPHVLKQWRYSKQWSNLICKFIVVISFLCMTFRYRPEIPSNDFLTIKMKPLHSDRPEAATLARERFKNSYHPRRRCMYMYRPCDEQLVSYGFGPHIPTNELSRLSLDP